jgi:addiction module RelE/StbE family toxin
MKILWTKLALNRIEEIANYIAEDNPSASQKWKREVYQKTQNLRSFPKMGRMVPEVNRDEVREIFYGNYRIIYRIEPKRVSILTVRHGKQLLKRSEINDR